MHLIGKKMNQSGILRIITKNQNSTKKYKNTFSAEFGGKFIFRGVCPPRLACSV